MSEAADRERLAADLRRLGVAAGDTLFVHSSFKSLGPVEGGAPTVIAALEDAIGPDGLLLMPSFNLVAGGNPGRAAGWDPETTPSTVGWLTECFRRLPGTCRSDHFSHAVAARGPGAEAFVAGHLRLEGMCSPWDFAPWGKAYGDHSPMIRAYHRPAGKILMLGVDYHSSTYCHVVEVMDWNRRLVDDSTARYGWIDRDKLGAWWDEQGRLARGNVGQADSRLFGIRAFVDAALAAVRMEPTRWFKG